MDKLNQNSTLRTPLNDILGSKGHIIILRQLSEAKNPMSHSELLERTNLSRQGVYDVVRRLVENGIIMYVGSGKQQQVAIRKDFPLSNIIEKLFEAEKKRFNDLIKRIQELIKNLEIQPKSAWIFGKVALGVDEYGDTVQIALLDNIKNIDEITDELRNQLYYHGIEKKYDITIDITGFTIADLRSRSSLNPAEILMLWGYHPQHYLKSTQENGGNKKSHQELDQQSLENAKAWTELLKTHPEIIRRTINYLEARIGQTSSGEKQELQEWKHILESMSYQRLKKFLESDSERSTRLRQSLPFWPVLNDSERLKLEKIKSDQSNK